MNDATPVTQPPAMQPFASWNPTHGIWETKQLDLYGLSAPFSAIWPTCGWMRNGSVYRLPLSALLTSASASSPSPGARFRTPLATDSSRGGETLDQVRARRGTNADGNYVFSPETCPGVAWVLKKKIIPGATAKNFKPAKKITRAQAATILYRSAGFLS